MTIRSHVTQNVKCKRKLRLNRGKQQRSDKTFFDTCTYTLDNTSKSDHLSHTIMSCHYAFGHFVFTEPRRTARNCLFCFKFQYNFTFSENKMMARVILPIDLVVCVIVFRCSELAVNGGAYSEEVPLK